MNHSDCTAADAKCINVVVYARNDFEDDDFDNKLANYSSCKTSETMANESISLGDLCYEERNESYVWVNISSDKVTVMDCAPFTLIDEGTPGWFWPIIVVGGLTVLGVAATGIYLLVKKITPWEEEAEEIRKKEAEAR